MTLGERPDVQQVTPTILNITTANNISNHWLSRIFVVYT